MATGVGATIGAGLFWLIATFFLGRVYCSSVCPVGTLQDVVIRLRRALPGRKGYSFSYKKGNKRRYLMLGVYAASMVLAIGCVPLLLEPWPAFINALDQLSGQEVNPIIAPLGVGGMIGVICAAAAVLLVLVYSMIAGRDFCNEVCPVGTVLRAVGARSVLHIELIPDRCTSCLKCEEVCKASCIDIKTRTIDNGRCVRCFNCVSVCEDDAIRYTPDRNGILTGLLQRRSQLTP